jgi:predicted enzyme related to lactoylglutathione lyase
MDYETVSADVFGASLKGLGINLLVPDMAREITFLTGTFGMTAHRVSADFAIMTLGEILFQLHSDGTYAENPYQGLLPETPPRGAGAELRLYDIDPDEAAGRAEEAGGTILQEPTDKPHGLREAYILSPSGYCWVPSRPREDIS